MPVYVKDCQDGAEGAKKAVSPSSISPDPRSGAGSGTGGAGSKWRDFDETVRSYYIKSTRAHRKDIEDFDESSEPIIADGLTDFIEEAENKERRRRRFAKGQGNDYK